jgi:hypothetical protein
MQPTDHSGSFFGSRRVWLTCRAIGAARWCRQPGARRSFSSTVTHNGRRLAAERVLPDLAPGAGQRRGAKSRFFGREIIALT